MARGWRYVQETGNYIMDLDGNAYLSYQPFINNPYIPNIPLFRADSAEPETALFFNGSYYILNGDFRRHYRDAIKKYGTDPEALLYYVFYMHPEQWSTWTTGSDLEDWVKKRKDGME